MTLLCPPTCLVIKQMEQPVNSLVVESTASVSRTVGPEKWFARCYEHIESLFSLLVRSLISVEAHGVIAYMNVFLLLIYPLS